jgi:hypothetical protein
VKKVIRSVISVIAVAITLTAVSACGSSVGMTESGITLKAGEVLTFSENQAGGAENGWWDAESAGNWSKSERPILNLEYDDTFKNGMNLNILMSGFVVEKNPSVSVSIKANEELVKEVEFSVSKTSENVSLDISKEILSRNKGVVVLTFEITNSAVPNEVGYNADMRKLGIFLGQMIATPTP